jgi:hypothetical protein
MIAPGGTFDFPTGGVTSFDVSGINPTPMLNPDDTTAFITGLTLCWERVVRRHANATHGERS